MTVSLRDSEADALLEWLAVPRAGLHTEHGRALTVAAHSILADLPRRIRRDREKAERRQQARTGRPAKQEPWTWENGRQAALERAGGLCEVKTPWCETLVTQVHHIAGRNWRGCHHPDLLLAVCGEGNLTGCHGWIHQHPDEARERGWLRNADEARAVYGTRAVRS